MLPGKQSQAGPGVAVADVDGDGDEDLFVGGAAGQGGVLWVQREGAWRAIESPFAVDSMSEDMGVLFFDADGDRDLDLYVVSGGVEAAVEAARLERASKLHQSSAPTESKTEDGKTIVSDVEPQAEADCSDTNSEVVAPMPVAAGIAEAAALAAAL